MSNTWDYGVLPPDFPGSSGAKIPWSQASDDRVEAARRWAAETLLDRFGFVNLKDAEDLVQYVLHGRTEA